MKCHDPFISLHPLMIDAPKGACPCVGAFFYCIEKYIPVLAAPVLYPCPALVLSDQDRVRTRTGPDRYRVQDSAPRRSRIGEERVGFLVI
jgi:hypothetical protein